jgi:membrane protease YdiL (CAAX protease family)
MRWIARLVTIAVFALAISDWIPLASGWFVAVLPAQAHALGSVPLYTVWLAVGAMYAVAWPDRAPTPWRARPSSWSRRDWIIIAIGAGFALSMYAGYVVTVINSGATAPRLDFLGGGVMAPFVEEWIFRGLVWNQIDAVSSDPRRGVVANLIVGSLIFGLYHMSFEGHSWTALGFAFTHALFGFLIGLVRWRSRSLLPGALVHMIGNSIARFAMP